jgi:dTMP kinase
MSLFITFEGGEGSGKGVQTRALYRRLVRSKIPAILVHEPGSTPVGERMTRLLKWANDTNISPLTELMLFNASRAQLVDEVIRPALKEGKVVICDRYADSTTAYQGYGRGLDIKTIKHVNSIATGGLKPDLTVLLDIKPEHAFKRIESRQKDRFENEKKAFHQRVRKGFLTLAQEEPQRWLVIDASLPESELGQIIWEKVNIIIPKRAGK